MLQKFWRWAKPYTEKAKYAFIGGALSIALLALQDPELLDLVGEIPDIGPVPTNRVVYVLIPLAFMWVKRESDRRATAPPDIAP